MNGILIREALVGVALVVAINVVGVLVLRGCG